MKREPRWVGVFLKQLERTGNVRLAAERAGVDFSTAYQRRTRHEDFAERWEGALEAHASCPAWEQQQAGPAPPLRPSPGGEGMTVRPDGKLARAGEGRWTKRAEEAFLLELTVSGNVSQAARAAGFSTTAVYRRRMKEQRFAAAWEAAMETAKARVQAYLVEAATRTFDPDELPIEEGRELPTVSISQAISIARLKGGSGSAKGAGGTAGAAGAAGLPGGYTRGCKGFEDRIYDETGFDCTPITRDEWEEARQNIIDRLQRLRERGEEEERETGRCQRCGQLLPDGVEND